MDAVLSAKTDGRAAGAPLLTPGELAERWKVPVRLLANWRYEGRGPAYTKLEGCVRYRLVDVEAYELDHHVAGLT